MLGATEFKSFPGTETLKRGWISTGFFGEIPGESLITYSDLIERVGLIAGTPHNEDQGWLVFNKDQHPLYISKRTLVHGISYDELDAAGLIDGSLIIPIGGFHYRVRLLTSDEWDRFMYPIHVDDPVNWKWNVNYTDDDLGVGSGNGRGSWAQETNPSSPTRRVYRGSGTVGNLHASPSSSSFSVYGWRVVLEPIESPTEHTPLRSSTEGSEAMQSADLEVKDANDPLTIHDNLAIQAGETYHRLLVHQHHLALALGITVLEISPESVLSDKTYLELCEEVIEEIDQLSTRLKLQNENDAQRLEAIEAYVDGLTLN